MNKNLDLMAPGAIDRLLAFHKSTFGETRMELEQPAETITVTVPQTPPTPQTNPGFDEEAFLKSPTVQALLAQVRKEEKDKLYPTIEDLKGKVSTLTESREAEIRAAEEKARKDAEDAAAKRFEETSAKDLVKDAQNEWEKRFESLQAERAAERAAFEKEREFLDLTNYTQSAVRAAIDNNEIAPELSHLVVGNNRDEVAASLESIKVASANIAANVQAALSAQPAQPPARGVSPTGYAAMGPMDQIEGTRTLTPADIRNMPMHEYAKMRGQLGVARESANVGLFGR